MSDQPSPINARTAYAEMLNKLPQAIQEALSVEGANRSLRVNRVWVDTSKHDKIDLDDYQDAVGREITLSAPIFADISLLDKKTGQELMVHGKPARTKAMRIGEIPVLTPHDGYLVNGVGYAVHHQLRLDPSIYTVVKDNGQLVSAFNLAHGSKGRRMGISFDAGKGVLQLTSGTSKTPLVPVLHALGIPDDRIAKYVGGEFLAQNNAGIKDEGQSVREAAHLLTGQSFDMPDKAAGAIKEFFLQTKLDPVATARVHGIKDGEHSQIFGSLTPELMLMQAAKHMKVYRGEESPDDRNSLVNTSIHGADDHIPGRFRHWKNKNLLQGRLAAKLDSFDSIKKIVNESDVSRIINRYFLSANEGGTGMTQVMEENNPVQIAADSRRVTRLGEGGISGQHSVPNSARLIHNSHVGVIDLSTTPEGSKVGVVLNVAAGARRIGNKLGTDLLDMRDGGAKKTVMLDQYHDKVLAFPDQYKLDAEGNSVPVNKQYVRVIKNGKLDVAPPSEVDYIFPSGAAMYSPTVHMVPFANATAGVRAIVGGKMIEQALPLKYAEQPLVRSMVNGKALVDDPKTGGARTADVDGTVASVEPGRIHVRTADGKLVKHGLYNYFPSQSGALFHHEPVVKVGDEVKKGQLLADSSFTRGGVTSLGVNLNTAFMSAKSGRSFEDGIVISESAAKKLTSRHMSVKEFPLDETSFAHREKFRVAYPGHVTREQADRMDNDGVLKVGSKVSRGEPIILGLKRRMPSEEEAILSKVSRKIYKPLVNAAVSWDEKDLGEIVKVEKQKNKIKVYIQHDSQMVIGDKMSGMGFGDKGVVAEILPDSEMPISASGRRAEVIFDPLGCYDEKTQFLTRRGWLNGFDLGLDDEFATVNPATFEIEYQKPSSLTKEEYQGEMYKIENQQIDLLVTPHHTMLVAPRKKYSTYSRIDLNPNNAGLFQLLPADEIFGIPKRYLKTGVWNVKSSKYIRIPDPEQKKTGPKVLGKKVLFSDWAEFVGWYVAEGYRGMNNDSYRVDICQSWTANKTKCERIVFLIKKMGFNAIPHKNGIIILNKAIYSFLDDCGDGASNKRIPQYILSASREIMSAFLSGYILGDGSVKNAKKTKHYNCVRAFTTSERLADDLQELAFKSGMSLNIKFEARSKRGIRPILGKMYTSSDIFSFAISKSHITPRVNWHENAKMHQTEGVVSYDGFIFCATVPNGTLTVRRNGKVVVSGNTVGRKNPSAHHEATAGAIAQHDGKPMYINSFTQDDYDTMLKRESEKRGLPDGEDHIDPATQRVIKGIKSGPRYWMKLKHVVASKFSSRDTGGIDIDGQPVSGGEHGSKRMDPLQMYAVLAHGAHNVLQDVAVNKSNPNDEMMYKLRMGLPLPPPRPSFAAEKMMALLNAAGINTVKTGERITLMPLTDKDALARSNGEVTNPGVVYGDKMQPEAGGLFDESIVGGQKYGCFSPDVLVWTEDGQVPIGEIVKNKLRTRVWSYDWAGGRFILQPITNWFENFSPIGVGKAVFKNKSGDFGIHGNITTLKGTPEHQVYDRSGNKVGLGDTRHLLRAVQNLTDIQREVLYGSLLGDGGISKNGHYEESHCEAQKDYLTFKTTVFSNLMRSGGVDKRVAKSGYGAGKTNYRFALKNAPVFSIERDRWYKNGKKIISEQALQTMGPLALAVWYMDDGCKHVKSGAFSISFATHSFSSLDVDKLRGWLLQKFKAESWISPHKRYSGEDRGFEIRVSGESARILLRIIAPYVVKCLRYKIDISKSLLHCYDCGKVIARNKRCNKCRLDFSIKTLVPKVGVRCYLRKIYGTTEDMKKMAIGILPIPEDALPSISQDELNAISGTALRDVLLAAHPVDGCYSLDEIPCKFLGLGSKKLLTIKTVYDIQVSGNHNYFANGILVSNSKWSHIQLSEPFPSPVMASAIQSITGMTEAQLEGITSGKLGVDPAGNIADFQPGMTTGGNAIGAMLDKINPQEEFDNIRAQLQGESSRSKIDKLNKRGKYLRGLINSGLAPRDAYLINYVPVLPPHYRPIVPLPNGQVSWGGMNGLYRDLMLVNQKLSAFKDLGPEHTTELRESTYDALKALQGLGDPISNREYRGVMRTLGGVGSPKCYDGETEILTRDGWVRFDKYDGRSIVGTVNLVTDRFEWQAPDDVIHQRYTGPMYHTKLRDLDLLVTPNHNHIAQVRTTAGHRGVFKFSDWRMVRADKIAITTDRRRLMTAAAWWDGVTPTYEFDGVRVDANALASVCGWWVAEGWISGHSRPPGGKKYFYPRVVICQLASNRFTPDIDECVKNLGLPFSRREYDKPFTNVDGKRFPDRKVVYWTFNESEAFAKWMVENFGKGADRKFISPEVLDWSGAHLRLFLDGYLMGDAMVRDRRPGVRKTHQRATGPTARFSTVSKRLADDIQALCVKIGCRASSRWEAPQTTRHRPKYRGSVLGHRDTIVEYPRHTTKVDFDGMVYSVTVPNGTVVVRRNGIVAVSGNSGYIQRKLLGRPMDAVGRSTIIPDPSLHMDEVGIPEDMAWRTYQPFIVREMVKVGIPPLQAAEEVEKRTPRAAEALDKAMMSRPAILNRAPSLHKYSVMAFHAKRMPGDAIQLPPMVFKGFNADTDGDSMTGDVMVRFEGGPPTLVSIEDLARKCGGTQFHARLKGVKIPAYSPLQGMQVMSISAGTLPAWANVFQITEHRKVNMLEVYIKGIPSPLVVSEDASLMTIDPVTGFPAPTMPRHCMDRLVPSLMDFDCSAWEARSRSGDFEQGLEDGRSGTLPKRLVNGLNLLKASAHLLVGDFCSRSFDYRLGYVLGRLRAVRNPTGINIPTLPGKRSANAIKFMAASIGMHLRFLNDGKRWTVSGVNMRIATAIAVLQRITDGDAENFWVGFEDNALHTLTCAKRVGASMDFFPVCYTTGKKKLLFDTFIYKGWLFVESGYLYRKNYVPYPDQKSVKDAPAKIRNKFKKMAGRIQRQVYRESPLGETHFMPLLAAASMLCQMQIETPELLGTAFYKSLRAYCAADVAYEQVRGLKKLGIPADAYDFNVPNAHVFCSAGGVSLKNTMMVSVPMSNEAVNEAYATMMPSKNLINPGTHGLMVLPSKATLWGLWSLTKAGAKTDKAYANFDDAIKDHLDGKTTATDIIKVGDIETTPGRIEVNSHLPEHLRDYTSQMDYGKLKHVLNEVATKDPKSYDDIVFNLKASGDEAAYFMGMTLKSSDLAPARSIRDKILKDAMHQYESGPRTKERMLHTFGQANTVMEKQLDEHYAKNPNALWDMINSGAMGKKSQAMQMIVAPLVVNDGEGNPIPFPVMKSYSEGLSVSDYIATLHGERKGIIDRAVSTAEPGEIQKETIVAALKQQITGKDSPDAGIDLPLTDLSMRHRRLAVDIKVGGRTIGRRNEVVTSDIIADAQRGGLETLRVRSPMTDESEDGVSQYSAGLNENGEDYPLGYNLGALAATTISEPLTQGVLKNFHQGNTAFSRTVSGLDRVRQLIELPKMAAGQGPLASVDGEVEDVSDLPSGDTRVTIGGKHHFIPAGMLVQIKKGETVLRGAQISSGIENPHEILTTRGVHAARKHIADEMHKVYKEGNNIDLDKRHFELIAKTLSDHAYVHDPGDAVALLRGDTMPIGKAEAYNRLLKQAGKKEIEYEPQLKGAVQSAISSQDWLARTSSRMLSKNLQEAAGFGLSTNISGGGHPVSKYIWGAEMSSKPQHNKNHPSEIAGVKLEDLSFHGPIQSSVHEKPLQAADTVK